MNSGMFASLSGSLGAEKRMDMISHNLANANTPGYKRDKIGFETLLNGALNQVPNATTADPLLQKENAYLDFSPGAFNQSGNPLDVAIEGDGFFTIQTPQGVAYTRQGNFHLNDKGELVTVDGYPVQGQNGGITLKGSQIHIDPNGEILVDGTNVAKLSIVDFQKPYKLNKIGASLFTPEGQQTPDQAVTGKVAQGFLEGSNVDVVTEMTQMIQTSRDYETYSKAIKTFDDMTNKAVNELGRL